MQVTYKQIAAINDLFKRIADTPMPIGSAKVFLDGLIELEDKYAEIDNEIQRISLQFAKDEVKEVLDKFLEEKTTTLEMFPISISDPNLIRVTPVELLRLKGFIEISN